jgi:hydrogenase expression/formation protein HypE
MKQETLSAKTTNARDRKNRVVLAHGGGGQLTDELLKTHMLPRLGNPVLKELLDAGLFSLANRQVAMSVDSFVVQPLFFPGGDIGRLAVSGTINDVAVTGARPEALALSMIIEEGLETDILDRVLDSIAETAAEADVPVVTGDTKVVGHGQADGMYITTAGIGLVDPECQLSLKAVQPGDLIIINGPIADHGLAVMLAREMPEVESVIRSDAAPLNHLIQNLPSHDHDIAFMRDPTRGGVAGVLTDLARQTGYRIIIEEPRIPLRPETKHAADMLGLDPLEVANEGKVIMVARPYCAEKLLGYLRSHALGKDAQVIGHVTEQRDAICEVHTEMGGSRILQKPYGEQLPRIC